MVCTGYGPARNPCQWRDNGPTGVDAHEDVLQPGSEEAIRATDQPQVFVGRIDPVRPMAVNRDRPGEKLAEQQNTLLNS
jgi:hypothetical protein